MPERQTFPEHWLGPVELLPSDKPPPVFVKERVLGEHTEPRPPQRDACDEESGVRRRYGWRTKLPEQRLKPGWLMGLAVSTELSGVMIGYMAQGMTQGGGLAMQYFFKDELHVGPAQLSSIKSLLALPWLIRPLYGLISDCRPLLGYHRRSYLMISGVVASSVYVVWAFQVDTLAVAVSLWVAVTLSSAMIDVILDGASCEMSRGVGQSTAGALQSVCRLSFAMGALVVACVTGYMIDAIGSRPVILTMGAFMLINLVAGCLIADTPGGGDPLNDASAYKTLRRPLAKSAAPLKKSSKKLPPPVPALSHLPDHLSKRRTREEQILRTMWSTIKQRRVMCPLIFVFVFMATPQTSNAMFYFYINRLGFSSQFMAQMAILARVADVMSSLLYARFFKSVSLRKLFFWAPVCATALGLSQIMLVTGANRAIGIPDQWFVFGDTIFLETITRVALLHLMVLCSNLCPAGCESTMFALIMSATSASYLGLGNLGGSLLMWAFGVTSTDFTNLAYLLLAANLAHLVCLPLLFLVPRHMEPIVRPTFTPSQRRPRQPPPLQSHHRRADGSAEQRTDSECGGGAEQSPGGGPLVMAPDSELGFALESHPQEGNQPAVDRGLLHRKMRYLQRHHSATKPPPPPPLPVSFDAGYAPEEAAVVEARQHVVVEG